MHSVVFVFRAASEGALKGILGYTDEDVVSDDFVGDARWVSTLQIDLTYAILSWKEIEVAK